MKFYKGHLKSNIARLAIVNLLSLVALGVAFLIILYLFSFVQNKVNNRIVESAKKAAKSYEIGKSFSRLELDIHNVHMLSGYDSERVMAARGSILTKFDSILTEVYSTENYFRGTTGLVSLAKYRQALALELDGNVLVNRQLLDLEARSEENLRLLSELEELVGEMIIESVVADRDPSVYHQISAIIPYCRELILQARYLVYRATSFNDADYLLVGRSASGMQSTSSIIEQLVRTLYTLTSASPPIADKVNLLLQKVFEYKELVALLEEAVNAKKVHHEETEAMVGLVVSFMSGVDRQTSLNLQSVVSAGNNSLNQARYVIYTVSALVMFVAIFGALMVYRIARQMAETTQLALQTKDELADKIDDLDLEINRRQKAEDSLQLLNMELENRVVERTDQLQAANKELDSFAYSVSHDLRAPLRSIGGFSQILGEDYSSILKGDGLDYLARIQKGCQRMGSLIDDMLKLSRLTRNELVKSQVDLSSIFFEIAVDYEASEPTREVEWVIQPGVTALVDPVMIRVVIDNLLGNAWKYTKNSDPCRIEFGSQLDGDKKVFFVKDNGAGFDMRYAAKLFTAFQRLHSTRDFAGDGIGLATVQRIINRHGGRVWGEGKEGAGACFYFML